MYINRTVIIILALFVLVLGAIIGAYFYFATEGMIETPEALRDVLPFGSGGESRDTSRESGSSDTETELPAPDVDDAAPLPELRTLHDKPVAGAIAFEAAGTSTVRFVERETGHVFDIREDERSSRRITNTTIPRIQEALFANPNTVLLRYINDSEVVQTYAATIPEAANGTGSELSGDFLAQNAGSITVRDGAVFYTVSDEMRGYVQNLAGSEPRSVLPVPFTEWVAAWRSANTLSLTTAAAAGIPGALYTLNTDTSSLVRVLGDRLGLTTNTAPDGSRVLFSEARDGSQFALGVLDAASGEVTPLPQRTLPEKCAWSSIQTHIVFCGIPSQPPNASYPDDWYRGAVSFSDSIWMIDTNNAVGERIVRPEDIARTSLDVVKPLLTADESHLVFVNRVNGSLWLLELPESKPESTQ